MKPSFEATRFVLRYDDSDRITRSSTRIVLDSIIPVRRYIPIELNSNRCTESDVAIR